MNFPSIDNTSVVGVAGQCTSQHHIFAMDNIENTIYNGENHEK